MAISVRDADHEPCSMAWRRSEVHGTAHEPDALVYARQPEAPAAACFLLVKSCALIGDRELDVSLRHNELYLGLARAGVPRDIAQRLLGDAIYAERDVSRHVHFSPLGDQ